jgi:bacteriocin-like protein
MHEIDTDELDHVTGGVVLSNGKTATDAQLAYIKRVALGPTGQHAPGFNPALPGGGILESVPRL